MSLKKQIFTNLKKSIEHIELPAKLLDYFLRSNKSNINPSMTFKSLVSSGDPFPLKDLNVW